MKSYSYPAEAMWGSPRNAEVTTPDYSKWVRTADTPDEYQMKLEQSIETPTRVSIKFDTVGDIYSNASFIDSSARVANHRGVRNSFAYSEVGVVTDSVDATYKKLIPATVTINVTQSVLDELGADARVAIVMRALGAFIGAVGDDDADDYSDVIHRLIGSLKPHHKEG